MATHKEVTIVISDLLFGLVKSPALKNCYCYYNWNYLLDNDFQMYLYGALLYKFKHARFWKTPNLWITSKILTSLGITPRVKFDSCLICEVYYKSFFSISPSLVWFLCQWFILRETSPQYCSLVVNSRPQGQSKRTCWFPFADVSYYVMLSYVNTGAQI